MKSVLFFHHGFQGLHSASTLALSLLLEITFIHSWAFSLSPQPTPDLYLPLTEEKPAHLPDMEAEVYKDNLSEHSAVLCCTDCSQLPVSRLP